MNSCSNCGLCYAAPTMIHGQNKYRCMRGYRQPISDLFILGRTVCDKYAEVDAMILTSKK